MWCRSAVIAVARLVLLPGFQVLQVGSQQDHSPWISNIILMRSLIFQVGCSSHPALPLQGVPLPILIARPSHDDEEPIPHDLWLLPKLNECPQLSHQASQNVEQPIPVDPVELSSTKPVLRPFQNLITVLTWHLSMTRQMKRKLTKDRWRDEKTSLTNLGDPHSESRA